MLQAQAGYDSAGNQPLPPGTPGRATPESVGIKDPGDPVTLLFMGDSGGITNPEPQISVAAAMVEELSGPNPPVAAVHVGDEVYYDGEAANYVPQFWEPYAHFQRPIVGVPGNHDGTPVAGVAAGIAVYMANFCTASPVAPPSDPDLEYGRHTMTQPYCDWTLNLKAVTLIGVWSNVKSGGNLYQSQQAWLTEELKAAGPSVPVVVYCHHPCFSIDAMHGGSAVMTEMLDGIFNASRWPDMVIAGHIHDQQVLVRTRPGGTTTYIVIGNSGYRNTHPIAGDYVPGMQLPGGITVPYAWADGWGYLKMTASGGKLSGQFVQVALDGTVTPAFEFSS